MANANDYVTRTEFAAAMQKIDARFDEVNSRFDQMQEQMRDMQTELLKAFMPWQEVTEVRMRKLEMTTSNTEAALEARMATIERRLREIEKKLLMEPPAA